MLNVCVCIIMCVYVSVHNQGVECWLLGDDWDGEKKQATGIYTVCSNKHARTSLWRYLYVQIPQARWTLNEAGWRKES